LTDTLSAVLLLALMRFAGLAVLSCEAGCPPKPGRRRA